MRSTITLLVFCSLGCAGAASLRPDGSPSDGPAGAAEGSAGAGADSGGCPAPPDVILPPPRCNSVANGAHAVPFTARTGTAPVPAGGPIRDGLYVSTASEGYGAIAASGRRVTLAVIGGATEMLWTGEVLDASAATVTLSFTADTRIAASGNQIAFTVDCVSASPSPIPAALTYTADGDQLILSRAEGADVAVTTYTRAGCLGTP
ncbi:MAG TPA: hypothetical protein VMU50_03300 [Polyangia bacterium]|nr:hypothetical protein [Polyangia bacterium]